jgi:demethylmenaquinone methyltransferase/2-methoxy-6-polyprenyl-1,4-benzoquinol methylase
LDRKPLDYVVGYYDRVALFYRVLEPLFGVRRMARRKATEALGLKIGDTVLEIGVGSGRNLSYLVEAVGPGGSVTAVDASAGMLEQARRLVARRGWSNVELIHQDALQLETKPQVDAVLFGLSYSVLPNPRPVLARAWQRVLPGGRLAIFDISLLRPEKVRGKSLVG